MMNLTNHSSQNLSKEMTDLHIAVAVLSIIIYVAGLAGNILSFLLLARSDFRQVSTGLTFLFLNIFGTMHLFSVVVEFLDSIFQFQMIGSAAFRCQFILWLQNVTRTICSFLATTISIDRFLRSEYPMLSRIWCTPSNIVRILCLYCLFSMGFYTFFFHPSNIFDVHGLCSFVYHRSLRIFILKILPSIRFVKLCLLPSLIMLICGARMISNIRRSKPIDR
jgi:hypothetical protein